VAEKDSPYMGSFDSFGLQPALLKGLARMGLTVPTPVQEQAIPLLMAGKDAICMAKTGSGKTLAFGLPVLSLLKPGSRPQVLVVLPTRELALQVCKALADVGQDSALRTVAIYGGVGLGPQETALRNGVDVVVGTPGRLKDLLNRGSLDLRQVSILILDEADEMLDMGFRRDIEFLLDRLPGRKQTLIFSATMPAAIEVIARKHMNAPTVVKLINQDAMPDEISHHFVRLQAEQRLGGLVAILQQEKPERAIIFTRMKHETKRLAIKLEKAAGIKAGYLNGNMSQNARNRMMDDFKSGQFRFLIATDVAARGLHVDGLSHVIHYAVPTVVETYIHRSGRTGRAGQSGKTIIFVTPDAEGDFHAIRKQVPCDEIPVASLGLESLQLGAVDPDPGPPPRGQRRGQSAPRGDRNGDRASSGSRQGGRGPRPASGAGDSRSEAPAARSGQGQQPRSAQPAPARSGQAAPARPGQSQPRSAQAAPARAGQAPPARGGQPQSQARSAQPEQRSANPRSEQRSRGAQPSPAIAPVAPGSTQDQWNRRYPKR
jgi:ATP-dependent RNA helicase RhlE